MSLNTLFALMPPSSQPGTQEDPKAAMLKMVGMMVVMGLVFYFLIIRGPRQQQKKIETLLKSLKPGDKVRTSSGIVGIVLTVKDNTVTLRSADTKLEMLKSAVIDVTERATESSSQ